MKTLRVLVLTTGLVFVSAAASLASLTVSLTPSPDNPAASRMGDRLSFRTTLHNDGATPIHGLIAWISLLRIDPGHEEPMDLEDWSAHKAVTAASLEPGGNLATDWPMRLIAAGRYRVVVCAVDREEKGLITSPFVDFSVLPKPVVESSRVLPVALGVPLLLGGLLFWQWRKGR